jgi:uncharacterized protein YqjF (DUF2071 family)
MPQSTPFLTAQWRDLALVTYRIDAELLRGHLARGLEPDRLPGDEADVAYVSLVAFRFVDTRIKGIPIPLHRDFPEVNLRVYVRSTDETPARRGVAFIAELVPRAMISTVANVLYHEHYRTVPMTIDADDTDDGRRRLQCEVEFGERTHRLTLHGKTPPVEVADDSVEHFFKEHSWGFGASPDGERVTYEVSHPVWRVYPVEPADLQLDWSFGELYGHPWQVLDDMEPAFVAFAEGSEIAVYPRESSSHEH